LNFKKELSNFGKSFKVFNIFWIIKENGSVRVKLYFFEFKFPVVKQKNDVTLNEAGNLTSYETVSFYHSAHPFYRIKILFDHYNYTCILIFYTKCYMPFKV
jgi:hypothetical protein